MTREREVTSYSMRRPPSRVPVSGAGRPCGVNAALMDDPTGAHNVLLGGLAMGISRDQVRERYREIVGFSGVDEKGDCISLPMRTYSSV